MKKMLFILGIATLTSTTMLDVVSCLNGKNSQNDDYFDSEINKIDPTIRNLVKYTSPIAKILIASRHENMNTYAFPTLQYFLNNVGRNLKGVFTTKSGEEIKIKDYVEEYKKLNNIYYNPWKAININYQPERNTYNLMSSIVAMTDFSKWNTKANQGHPSNTTDESGRYVDFIVNSNLAWAQYDTGTLSNTLSQKSDSVIKYIERTATWSNYYDSSSGPYVSNILYHNSLLTPPTKLTLSYMDGGEKIKFGKAVANQSSALYDLFGLKYFDEAITMISQFGSGLELPVLYLLAQLFPFVQNDRFGEKTAGIFLAAPFFILMQIRDQFFDKSGNVKSDSPLLEIFNRDTIEKTILNVENQSDGEVDNPDKTVKPMNLHAILNTSVVDKSLILIASGQKQYLDLTSNKEHKNAFLKWYSVLGNWFTAALAKEGSKFDVQKFNRIMSKTVYEGLSKFQGVIGSFAEDSVVALIRTLLQMLNASNFDLFSLLKGIAGLANWFYINDSEVHYNLNIDNVKTIDKVYNEGPKKDGFKEDLMAVDPNSEYAKFVLDNYGFVENTGQYKKGSLFDIINIWSHGGNKKDYPDHEAMHKFITQILDSQNGYIGELTHQVNKVMAEDWFDNIFLDRKWYITASGTGIDGTRLGAIVTNGHIKGVRYQLDYYGPKDASTKLKHHKKPLGYTDPNSGNSPSHVKQQDPKQRHNIAPQEKKWSDQDWVDYDGMGNEYLPNSEKIKYSYVVEFKNQVRFLYNPGIKDDLTKNSYLLSDFVWYYNNTRYY